MKLHVDLDPHARERAQERGVTEAEIAYTVMGGERRAAKFGRAAFRRNFAFGAQWRGRFYATKQVEAITVEDGDR